MSREDWVETTIKLPKWALGVYHAIAQAKRVPHPDVIRAVLIKIAREELIRASMVHRVALGNAIPEDIRGAWGSARDQYGPEGTDPDWLDTVPIAGSGETPTPDVEKRPRAKKR